jgi:hypothetical protein
MFKARWDSLLHEGVLKALRFLFARVIFFFQEHLETVVPQEGREVVILAGKQRGEVATLRSVHTESFSALLKLPSGEKLQLPYEQFSKRHVD